MSYTLRYTGSDIDTILGRAAPNGALDDAIAAKQDQLTFDTEPTEGSTNPVTSGGLYEWEKDIVSALYITDTASGSIASFSDGADGIPMKSVVCTLPYSASGYTGLDLYRSGQNLLKINATSGTQSGISFTINDDGSVTVNGTSTWDTPFRNLNYKADYSQLPKGVPLRVAVRCDGSAPVRVRLTYDSTPLIIFDTASDGNWRISNPVIIPKTANKAWMRVEVKGNGVTVDNVTVYPMVIVDDSVAEFDSSAELIPIDWTDEAGTVYGGTLDVVSGKLTSTMDASGHLLAEPIEYQLSAQQVTSLLGENNVWNTAGDTEATYVADPKLYIAKVVGGSSSAASTLSVSRPSLTLASAEPEADALADTAEPEAADAAAEAEIGEEA